MSSLQLAPAIVRSSTLRDELITRLCEVDLRVFMRAGWSHIDPTTKFTPGWHLDAVCDHLMGVSAGHITRLLINIPPRHTKSLSLDAWNAWKWGPRNLPQWRMLAISYGMNLAVRDSRYVRRLILSDWYQQRWGSRFELVYDQNAKLRFDNDRGGFRVAGSIEAGITGEGGHLVQVDDPHQLKHDTNPGALAHAIDIFTGTLQSRLNDQDTGAIVVAMQRVAENDLSAHVMQEQGYTVLCLPVEHDPKRACVTVGSVRPVGLPATPDDAPAYRVQEFRDPRTAPGELLCPERLSAKAIENFKKPTGLGLKRFNTQFNQQATSMTGTILPREAWKFWTVLPARFDEQWLSWDMAFKDASDSDHVVGQVWGRVGGSFYLIHQVRDQLSFSGSVAAVENMAKLYDRASAKLIEDKANGPAIINTLKARVSGLIAVNPEGGKVSRAWAVQPYQEAGNIFLPHTTESRTLTLVKDADGSYVYDPDTDEPLTVETAYDASWVPGLIEEAANFRGIDGQPDDQVDALTQALIYVTKRITIRIDKVK